MRALPLPFLRIGLANVIIVYLLWQREFILGFTVNVLKTLFGGMLSLTLFNPATILSLAGGILSFIVMWLLLQSLLRFSIIGISVSGAVTHNVMQIFCVRWIIIQRDSVFQMLPLLIIIGVVTGIITGIFAMELQNRMEGSKDALEA